MDRQRKRELFALWSKLKSFLEARNDLATEAGITGEELRELLSQLDELARQNWRAGKGCVLYVDGASRGNPGPSGIGIVIEDLETGSRQELSAYLGEATNNVAEYTALIRGLETARELGYEEVSIRSDSELLVLQMLGRYRVKNPRLVSLWKRAKELMAEFAHATIAQIPREENREADWLAVQAIDEALATGGGTP